MDIYLVRHADTLLGQDGLYPEPAPLSALGREQAAALAPRLVRVNATRVVTSGVLRAVETAAPYLEASGLEAEAVRGFDEVGIGSLRSAPPDVLLRRLSARPMRADFTEFDGESPEQFRARVLRAFEEKILETGPADGGAVVAVIHGGPIQVILDHVEGVRFDGVLTRDIPPASITRLRVSGDRIRVEYAGDAAHLDGLAV